MVKRPQLGVDSVLIGPTDAATTALTANLDCQGANYASIKVLLSAEVVTTIPNLHCHFCF